MSHSLRVEGLKDGKSEKFLKMFQAYNACKEAGIAIPEEVDKYFDEETPVSNGVCVNLKKHEAVSVDDELEDMCEGFIVDLSKLPEDITHLRFYISW